MLTTDQRDEFRRAGFLRLRDAVPAAVVAALCDRVWQALETGHGVRRDAPETWTVPRPAGFRTLERSGAFEAAGSAAVRDALDDLLGRGAWRTTWRWGRLLATFRTASRWDVPHEHWHLDFGAPRTAATLPGVNLFTFLAPVRPRGGGTLVVAGSHALVGALVAGGGVGKDGRSGEVRRQLKRAVPWLQELWSPGGQDRTQRFLDEGTSVPGAELRVVELTGEPGDVVLVHPWVFHTMAPNCRDEPRLMLVEFIGVTPRSPGVSGHSEAFFQAPAALV